MTTTTDNATIVRTVYDAFGRGDIPAVLDCFHPDLVWIEAAGGRYGGTYQGPQAVVDGVFAPIGSEWDGFLVEPERLVAEGDIVVVDRHLPRDIPGDRQVDDGPLRARLGDP